MLQIHVTQEQISSFAVTTQRHSGTILSFEQFLSKMYAKRCSNFLLCTCYLSVMLKHMFLFVKCWLKMCLFACVR